MTGALVVEIGKGARRYAVDKPTIIGQGAHCGIRIIDAYASREHALLRPTVHGWQVVDMGSTNGTWMRPANVGQVPGVEALHLPERRVHEALLGKGDRLRVGRTWMVVVPT